MKNYTNINDNNYYYNNDNTWYSIWEFYYTQSISAIIVMAYH